ncbi:MAG: hypothetical protein IKP71_01725 [Candidatus Riflebacteria bacterium]|nr:hypothetical protein [Candidatus Riflebacteria bacterium]
MKISIYLFVPTHCHKRNSFMAFMRRFLSAVFDNPAYEEALTIEEVIRMTKTFRDYDREKDLKEGEKKGEFNTVYNFIKKGRMTIEEAASDIGMTVDQLLEGFKRYNLVL